MKTLYLDCGMGAAGDMLAAALLELHPDRDGFIRRMNNMGLHGVKISAEKLTKCGICGTHFSVSVHGIEEDEKLHEHHHHHEHTDMHSIEHIISHLDIPEKVREDVLAVYALIAGAESKVHGVPVSDIHFHEVGRMDAIADITAVSLLISELQVENIVASPVCTGSGTVKCAHGILPVPAPATAELLKGIPITAGNIKTELCTPTGAALLKHFVKSFGDMPPMSVSAIGYGMGKKDFERANCLRAMLGESADSRDQVAELACNIDDMSAEDIAFAAERLMDEGALDVFTTAIGMKKSRPAVLLTVLCAISEKERFARLIFKYTSTLGIREYTCSRYVLERKLETRKTAFGNVRVKKAEGYGVSREKYEYEDLAAIAAEKGISLESLRKMLK